MINFILKKTMVIGIIVLFVGTSVVPLTSSTKEIDKIIRDKIQITCDSVEHTIEFEMPLLKQKRINGDIFTSVDMPGSFSVGNEPGSPSFLVTPIKLLLPPKMKVKSIDVKTETFEASTRDILKEAPVVPYQDPVPISEKPSDFIINHEAYKSRTHVPNRTYKSSGVDYCRGYAILTLNLYPTKYIPADGILFYHSEMTIKVTLEINDDDVDSFYRNDQVDKEWVKSLVVNPEVIETYPSFRANGYAGGLCDPSDNDGLGYDYVIITREALIDFSGTNYTWDDLIQRKQVQQDLEATKVSVEDILACSDYWDPDPPIPEFNDTAYIIREFCRDAYNDWGTQYILIGGDQDGPNAIERRLMDSEYEGDMESDLYWSNLDNTFNADFDDLWGERDDEGFDLYSELFIGSIPCDEPSDISNWLTKSFFYEDNYDPEYLDNAGFYGGSTGWSTEGDDFIDFGAIKGTDDWLGPDPGEHGAYPGWLGFLFGFETWNENNPEFAYNLSVKWTGDDPNPGWQGGSPTIAIEEFKDAINNNQVTLITSFAHANPYYSLDVHSDTWELDYHNTMPFFLCDWGCHCGDMDAADDGVLHSMLFNSDTSLAFGCTYNTGYGWGSFGDTNSSSGLQQKLFWDYMFNLDKCGGIENWQLGKAMAWSKDAMAPTIDWTYQSAPDSWRAIIECCLLFGDPALTVKPPVREGHNVGVHSLDVAENHIQSPEPIAIDAVIINNGMNNESDVEVRLLVNDIQVDSVIISSFPSYTSQQVDFIWIPSDIGIYTITVNVTITGITEGYYEDNEKTDIIVVGVHNVNTNKCFSSIQQAINDSDTLSGHNLFVPSGTYYEDVLINKSILLLGTDRNTTIIAGAGTMGYAVHIDNTDSVILAGFTIKNQTHGVIVESSSNTIIMDTMIVDNVETGIFLESSDNASLIGNEIFGNDAGINITDSSSMNIMYENDIFNNHHGLIVNTGCIDNLIYHNNFNNINNAFDSGSNNQWDNGYLEGSRICGGNWWSDYDGVDEFSGPEQNEPGSDGIGDIPYIIPGVSSSQDQYPLMEPYTGLLTGTIFVDNDNIEGPWNGTLEFPYQHIQDAINVTINGDTVFVFNGTYHENIVVDRSIHLTGEERNTTIIDGNFLGHVVHLAVDMINISGFTIQNSGTDSHDAGIYIKSNYNSITGNTITDNHDGINIYKRRDNNISENIVMNSSIGIFIYGSSQNNSISHNSILNNFYGIYLVYSSNNQISENTIIDPWTGINCYRSSDNIITNNYISDGSTGVYICFESNNNIVSENIFEDCNTGIYLDRAYADTYNVIIDNTFNSGGIFINAWYYYSWNSYTIENNTINGRPIRYYKNMNDLVVPQDTGQVILGNCSNITIQNLTIFNVSCGIQLGYSSNCTVERNTITNNTIDFFGGGISLAIHSTNNKIYNNTISLNSDDGIRFDLESNDNVISSNNLSGGGVSLKYCNNNTFSSNTITDSDFFNIYLYSCDNNTFSDNKIENSRYGLYLATDSHNNTIHGNTIRNHTLFGIHIRGSQYVLDMPAIDSNNNTIYHNNFMNNTLNAYDECNNTWYNIEIEKGNYWDDFDQPEEGAWDNDTNGIVDTPYNISGGNNQDLYPLTEPWISCPYDVNDDGMVDTLDYGLVMAAFGCDPSDPAFAPYDVNNDGVINTIDVGLIEAAYGPCPW